jgi:hypothetical protein
MQRESEADPMVFGFVSRKSNRKATAAEISKSRIDTGVPYFHRSSMDAIWFITFRHAARLPKCRKWSAIIQIAV